MSLRSSFADFSVVECFRLIEQGRKTGRLAIAYSAASEPHSAQSHKQYFWFQNGYLVAASTSLDGMNLAREIVRRNWLSQRVLEKLINLSWYQSRPLGLHLKLIGALQPEQIASLLGFQIRQLSPILETSQGEFLLDTQASLPYSEMTGLRLGAIEVAVGVLREVRQWKALEAALPQESSAIQRWKEGQPSLKLTEFEQKVFAQADGRHSLRQLAQGLDCSVDVVRHTAFRLMIANLVDEVPPLAVHTVALEAPAPPVQAAPAQPQSRTMAIRPPTLQPIPSTHSATVHASNPTSNPSLPKFSYSFLRGIVDFLRSRV